MIPIATISLDTPNSAGPVRGVVCWLPEDQLLRVYDPHSGSNSGAEEDGDVTDITTIVEALEAVSQIYGERSVHPDSRVWDIQYLCEDAEDYAA